MRKIETTEELYRLMGANNVALKSVQPISGNETFMLITSRYSPNIKVPEDIAKKFIQANDRYLKKIALNTASTTLYVLV